MDIDLDEYIPVSGSLKYASLQRRQIEFSVQGNGIDDDDDCEVNAFREKDSMQNLQAHRKESGLATAVQPNGYFSFYFFVNGPIVRIIFIWMVFWCGCGYSRFCLSRKLSLAHYAHTPRSCAQHEVQSNTAFSPFVPLHNCSPNHYTFRCNPIKIIIQLESISLHLTYFHFSTNSL